MKDAGKLVVAVLALAAASVLVACGSSSDSTADSTAGTIVGAGSGITSGFEPVAEAPDGYSRVAGEAKLQRADGGTVLSISVSGLEPKTRYIAHLHTGGCDQADPGGPHFQFKKGGSEEPPNEIHLRFTSNAAGEGKASATSKREVPVGEAGSVVLHLDDSGHEMTSSPAGGSEVETVFVHEGVDHSKEGKGHEGAPQHAHSEKIACAELEGPATGAGEATAQVGDVPTIVVRDGEPVDGIEELEYSAGEEVRFRVSSDAAEEIHVHGYDISKEVPAGGTIEIAFPAELEGIYEAELEKLGVQIAELQVNP